MVSRALIDSVQLERNGHSENHSHISVFSFWFPITITLLFLFRVNMQVMNIKSPLND